MPGGTPGGKEKRDMAAERGRATSQDCDGFALSTKPCIGLLDIIIFGFALTGNKLRSFEFPE